MRSPFDTEAMNVEPDKCVPGLGALSIAGELNHDFVCQIEKIAIADLVLDHALMPTSGGKSMGLGLPELPETALCGGISSDSSTPSTSIPSPSLSSVSSPSPGTSCLSSPITGDPVLNGTPFNITLSPLFDVETTKYGGRGCFSKDIIPAGRVVLRCNKPISSTLIKGFRKEVCNSCFKYSLGSIMKVKSSLKIEGTVYSLFFCSSQCKEAFEAADLDGILLNWLLTIERYFVAGLKKPEPEPFEPVTSDLGLLMLEEWSQTNQWACQKMKKSKWMAQIPRVNDMEYTEIKYIVGVIFEIYKDQNQEQKLKDNFELTLFDLLHSTEAEKVAKYPYLLYSYINIFKFIRCTAPDTMQPLITSNRVRSILGKSLSNAFGVWSETDNPAEDREYFGFAVYPSASYFNHSCAPNLKKSRESNSLVFRTLEDIFPGEELCIDYGNFLSEPFDKRREELSEWFFDCGCGRCEIESHQVAAGH